nr:MULTISPECIES: ATP-dependent DNA helicase [unclassified Bacillus (in: firmicutes)]
MTEEIKISVRTLVEYVFSSGSIDSRFRTTTSMTEGTKAHQKIQKSYGEHDHHEVYLEITILFEDINFKIEGRCDGILQSEDGVIIDEIKSTSGDLGLLEEDSYGVHWAQAKCYAYIYCLEKGLQSLSVQLTYYQIDTEEISRFIKRFTFDELKHFIMETVEAYAPFAQMKLHHVRARNESIEILTFPFETYREGQRKLAGAVYKSIVDSKNIFAKAPTGIGKTISTTFPSVKAIGEGHLQKFFYLTAKTITRQAAEEAFAFMKRKGLILHSVTLTAKEKMCLMDEVKCNPDSCPFAEGYYDRINGAILDILSNETNMTRDVIEQYSKKHQVCPFEFSLDLAYSSDAVICDYNYVFDPRVSLKRFFDEHKKRTALLIDEAHNLVDRAQNMYSAELFKSAFLDIYRQFKVVNKEVSNSSKLINDYLLATRKGMVEEKNLIVNELPEDFLLLIKQFIIVAEKELLNQAGDHHTSLLDCYYSAQDFEKTAKLFDERFVTYYEAEKSEVKIKLFCLDPSELLRQFGKGFRSKVYFSATFTPLDYFKEMLGADFDDYTLAIPSPFSPEQSDVYVYPLSTRFHDRESTKGAIVKVVSDLVGERKGNHLVFFPSYAYLMDVYESFQMEHPHLKSIVQERQMTEEQKECFLRNFEAETTESLIGFAVLGGIFSEGVDLVGNRLNGVVVVGVGLPQIGLERNIMKQHFTKTGKNGFDYAYVYPGMNKVLQAGGRLIRSENDYGTIVLVDDRFLQSKYQQLLPTEWQDFKIIRG